MSDKKTISVIGGGISGLFFALFYSYFHKNNDYNINIYNSDEKIGSRILVSGNGRCNIFNEHLFDASNFADQTISKILENSNGRNCFDLISKLLNIDFYSEEDRYYPFSNRSDSVYFALINILKNNKKINFIYERVKSLKNMQSDMTVYCPGGCSYNYPSFNYDILKELQVKYRPFEPSLCPLKVKGYNFKKFKGLRFHAKVELYKKNSKIYEELGEVMIKEDALSGICIMNCSSFIHKKDISDYLIKIILNQHENKTISLNVDNYINNLPSKLVEMISIYSKQFNVSVKDILSNGLMFEIESLYSFASSQVSSGGISTESIDFDYMKIISPRANTYALGEIIDIDVPCGGYNIGLALIEAFICAKKMN